MNFIQLAEKIIKEENKPLSPTGIWEIGVQKGYDKLIKSKGKTPQQTIAARIYIDINSKEIRKEKYDKVINAEELIKKVK